jgi:integrase
VGERFRALALTLLDLQGHIDRPRKKGVSPVTLKKEVASVRACWNWAVQGGLLKGAFPCKGLRFPKEEEKEPFRTFAEIEALVAGRNSDGARREALWEARYLTRPELEEFLTYFRRNGTLPWVFPMVAFAAYTGARRSGMLRALTADVDLAGGTVTVREKKRVRGKRSTRTAPADAEAGRGAAGVAGGASRQPVPVLPVAAGGAEYDEARGTHGSHQGRGPGPLPSDGGGVEVAGAAGLPRAAAQLHQRAGE